MAIEDVEKSLRQFRLRVLVLSATFILLAVLSYASAALTGGIHPGIWIAILFVATLLGITLWAHFVGPAIYARTK